MTTVAAPARILLVDDNPGDVRLTREALGELSLRTELHVAADGREALAFLHDEAAPRPDLILLDLNMPVMNGLELLGAIKAHACLRRIPVVVMTTSNQERDVLDAYDLHANGYVVKPLELEALGRVFAAIEGFFFGVVRRPST